METSNTPKRNRKRKSYGEDFEEMVDEEKTTNEESDASNRSPTVKEKSGSAKKSKKSANATARGGTTEAPKTASELRKNISAQHDELVVSAILGACPTSEPQHDELVVSEILGVCPISEPSLPKSVHPPKHSHFGGKEPKQHRPPPKCISAICRGEKEELKEELKDTKEELANTKKELANALEELRELKDLQPIPSSSGDLQENVDYGKLPRSVGQANNWEEISNGVWCCPIKVKAAVKNASTRTGLACALLGIFYPKEKLQGRRLHELDQDVIEAITDFSMVAKLMKEPKPRKTKDGDDRKPAQSPLSRSGIKQAMRMKCNTIISLQKKKDAR